MLDKRRWLAHALFMSGHASIDQSEQPSTKPTAKIVIEAPPLRSRDYVPFRADQLLLENQRLNLPSLGGFVRSFVEQEAEADRQSQRWGIRAGRYNGLYVLLGLPAAVLAAVAGVTVLASTAGRLAAGIVALMSAALSASATFLDSAKKRDQAAKLNTEWEDLYNEMRVCRLTELASFTTESGPSRLTSFEARAAAIRAGRDQATAQPDMAPAGGQDTKPLFYRIPNMVAWPLPKVQHVMNKLPLVLSIQYIGGTRAPEPPDSGISEEPPLQLVRTQDPSAGTPVPEGTVVRVSVPA
jgi:hypothetical protein